MTLKKFKGFNLDRNEDHLIKMCERKNYGEEETDYNDMIFDNRDKCSMKIYEKTYPVDEHEDTNNIVPGRDDFNMNVY